jgi:hypothetical protein
MHMTAERKRPSRRKSAGKDASQVPSGKQQNQALLDEALEETFPASDPVSISQPVNEE